MSSTFIGREDLARVFVEAETQPEDFRIGAESEKFGVHTTTSRPLGYGGDFSVCRVLEALERDHGWEPIREKEGAAVLGLRRGGASITLEPSVQFELSGAPLSDLHQVRDEAFQHLFELRDVSRQMGLSWLSTGFHPFAQLDELSWVPKRRYPIMREYLPSRGSGGLDMMQRTATTQGNFDWNGERDGMQKLVLALKLSPIFHAWFANAPFKEGQVSRSLSLRGHVWRHMDPARSGLIPSLWQKSSPTYEDYVEWALDAGMFLILRDGEIVANTGQPFRDFLAHGFEGHRATLDDWKLHLTTLFPEVRLKNTLEVRSVDALPPDLALASLALWTGILYDDQAREAAWELTESWRFDEVEQARPGLCDRGLHAEFLGRLGFEWAERLLSIAHGGLVRRQRPGADGRDEAAYLDPAEEILSSRLLPAERALSRYRQTASLVAATALSDELFG